MFDDCPKCGYPSKTGHKGLYTPGMKCHCGFVETDAEILALAARQRAAISERGRVEAVMRAAVQRVHGPGAPGTEPPVNVVDVLRMLSALRGEPRTNDTVFADLREFVQGRGAARAASPAPAAPSHEADDIAALLRPMMNSGMLDGDAEMTASLDAFLKLSPDDRRERNPEMVEAFGHFLKRRENTYADVILTLASALKVQRDRVRAAAAVKPPVGEAGAESLENTTDVQKFLERIFSGDEGVKVRRVVPLTEAEVRERLSKDVAQDVEMLLGALRVVRPDLADGFAKTLTVADLSTRWHQQSEGTFKLLTEQDWRSLLAVVETMKVAKRKAVAPTESEMRERLAKAEPKVLGAALRVIRGERAEGFAAAFSAVPQAARIAIVQDFPASEALRLFELVVRLESTMGKERTEAERKPAEPPPSEPISDMQEIISSLTSLISACGPSGPKSPPEGPEGGRSADAGDARDLFSMLPKDLPLAAELQNMIGATTPEARLAAERTSWARMGEDLVRMSQEPPEPTDATPDPERDARDEAEMQQIIQLFEGFGDPGAAAIAKDFMAEAMRLMKDDKVSPEERSRAVDAILAKAPAGTGMSAGLGMLEMFLRAPSQEARSETTRAFMGAMGECLIARSKVDDPSKVPMESVFQAAMKQATHPARVRRALAAGLLAIGITDIDVMTSVDESRVQYCLLMVKPGDVAPITFEHDRVVPKIPDEEIGEWSPMARSWIDRRRFLLAAAAALHGSVAISIAGNTWITTSDDGTFAEGAILQARPDGANQLAAEDLDAMGRLLGLTQPPPPAWLKEGVWVRGPIEVVHRGIGSSNDPVKDRWVGQANYVVTATDERVVHVTCAVAEVTTIHLGGSRTTYPHEEHCERRHTVGTILAHFTESDRALFALGLPCAACGALEPRYAATPCVSCARIAREQGIAKIEQQLAARA